MCSLAIHGRETLGNVGSYLDLSKYPGFVPRCLEGCALCKPPVLFFLQGVKEHSVPVGLDGKAQVDLIVVGSVAVSEKGKEELRAEGSQSQSSVSKATPRGRDRFILGAELWSWVLPLCVTNPCSQSKQEAAVPPGCGGHTAVWVRACFGLQENY